MVLAYSLPDRIASKIRSSGISVRAQVNNPQIVWMKQKDVRIDAELVGPAIPTSYVLGVNVNF